MDTLTGIKRKELEEIKITRLPSKPMSVQEALLQLKVSDIEFLAFTNSETGKTNVLYKGKGGNIGLIAP